MKTAVYNQNAEQVEEINLNPKIFEVKPSVHLLAEVTRIIRSNARQGTSNTKTRGEVRGGGKKPWKQKGTGRARAGSTRSPIWRHGGVTFGPRANQNWELKLNKKTKTKALFMSLSDKAKHNQLVIIDQINLVQPKTKEMVKLLSGLEKVTKNFGKSQLLVLAKADDKLMRSARNLTGIKTILANQLNALEILKTDAVITLKDSLGVIEKTFLKNSK